MIPPQSHPIGTKCLCVGRHVPLPQVLHLHHIVPKYMGGSNLPSNKIWICPNAHANIHDLIFEYQKYNGSPPASLRKHYSEFVQDLAQTAWNGKVTKTQTITSKDVT